MRTFASLFVFLFVIFQCLAQTGPTIQWQKSFGGTYGEQGLCGRQTSDGGYVVIGTTISIDGDVTDLHGDSNDFWVVKMDAAGALQWQKTLGGSDVDYASSMEQTMDGGYIVVGSTFSRDGDVTGYHGNCDMWVVKLAPNGDLQWQLAIGGSEIDYGTAVKEDSTGVFWVAGQTDSNDGDVFDNHSASADLWLVKLSSSGVLLWNKCYGGQLAEAAYDIDLTSDGGCVLAGYACSNDGDVSDVYGPRDLWVVKVDSIGNLQWQRALGGSGQDVASSVQQTADGGYIIAGEVMGGGGNTTGFHGYFDGWVVKLDSNGILEWQRALGGSDNDKTFCVQQTTDNGYIVAGHASSTDGDLDVNQGSQDGWVVKLDSAGMIQWQTVLGGSMTEAFNSVRQTSDGGFFLTGYSNSTNGDVIGNHGYLDIWVVKLNPYNVGISELQDAAVFSLYPNPTTNTVHIDLDLKAAAAVRLQLYDAAGKLVATVLDEKASAGLRRVHYSTQGLPAGLYELRLTAGGRTMTRRLLKE